MVFFVSLAELLLLITPFVLAITAAIEQQWLTAVWAGLAAMLICSVYASIVRMAYQQQLLKGVWLAPFAVLLNIYLRHESLWRYEFDEVTWKGRNVCIPVMHVIAIAAF
jgi:hypothetical protein